MMRRLTLALSATILMVLAMSAPVAAIPDDWPQNLAHEYHAAPDRPTLDRASRSGVRRTTYTIRAGDTLADIDRKTKSPGPWTRLAYVNRSKFDSPDVVEVGQKLTIPTTDGKRLKYTPPAPPAPPEQEVAASPSSPTSTSAKPSSSDSSSQASPPSYSAPSGGSVWYALAQCESGGDWSINTGNGYYGGLQFSLSSWRAVGGTGYPHEASPATQIAMGERLRANGGWGHWPDCSRKLGLR